MQDDAGLRTEDPTDGFEARVREELAPELSVVRLLGRSSVAGVFLCREPALRRLVAVKVLAPELSDDDSARRRFEREAQAAARIVHPNVVTVHRVGRLADGLTYLVMRYVKGRSLQAKLKAEGPLPNGEGCTVLANIASGIAEAHRHRIVHRDIKPANVIVEASTGRVYVVDFGIAAVLVSGDEEPERITTVGHLVGDPRYMSPERLLGEDATERSDVYNLGLLGYELFAGRGPYEADSNRAWTEAHLNEEAPDLVDLRPGIDPQLARLLRRCLAKAPDHRPDASDVEAVSRRLASDTNTVAARAPGSADAADARAPGRDEPRGKPDDLDPTSSDPSGVGPAESIPPRPPAPPGLAKPRDERLRFEVLGGLELVAEDGGRVLSVVAQPKRVALLAYLASGADSEFKRRDRIASVFWPDLEDEKARHALRQAVYVLRRSLGTDAVAGRGDDEVSLDRDVVWCDATAFERALDANRPDVAMELYRGQMLPGFYLPDGAEFERWLDNERLRLERLATDASWRLAAEREAGGDPAGALHWGRRAIELAPFDESLLRRLIELQLRIGDRAGALNAYENFARRLRDELEAEPTEQTLALVERIRAD